MTVKSWVVSKGRDEAKESIAPNTRLWVPLREATGLAGLDCGRTAAAPSVLASKSLQSGNEVAMAGVCWYRCYQRELL